jgi:hypothetical protein
MAHMTDITHLILFKLEVGPSEGVLLEPEEDPVFFLILLTMECILRVLAVLVEDSRTQISD